jgi:hypothetical protein
MIQIARVCTNFAFLSLTAAIATGSQLNSTVRTVLPRLHSSDTKRRPIGGI